MSGARRVSSGAVGSRANSRLSEASSAGAAGNEGGSNQTLDQDTGQDDLIRMQEIFEEADEDGGGGLDIDEFKGS